MCGKRAERYCWDMDVEATREGTTRETRQPSKHSQSPPHLRPQVKGAVCANINLLMEKEEEDFEKYLGAFATDIWTLLTAVSLEPRQVSRDPNPDWLHVSPVTGGAMAPRLVAGPQPTGTCPVQASTQHVGVDAC